jgi:hypothetical protein
MLRLTPGSVPCGCGHNNWHIYLAKHSDLDLQIRMRCNHCNYGQGVEELIAAIARGDAQHGVGPKLASNRGVLPPNVHTVEWEGPSVA